MVNLTIYHQLPGAGINRWISEKIFGDNIVLVIGRYLWRERTCRMYLAIVWCWRRNNFRCVLLQYMSERHLRCAGSRADNSPETHTHCSQTDKYHSSLQDGAA